MKTYENLHILLLKGGDGSERKVSLNTAIECAKAIKQIGCKITEVDIAECNISCLSKINADICFNALHGDYGEDGSIQGFLNLLKLPYTSRVSLEIDLFMCSKAFWCSLFQFLVACLEVI